QGMVDESRRHADDLAHLIDYLGGVPVPRLGVQSEEQYLAFLSLKFLLPKLAGAKRLMMQRYENALRAIGDSSPEITSVLRHHLEEHRSDLQILQKASTDVIAAK